MFQRFKDRGVVVVGVNPGGLYGGDTAAIVEQFVAQTGVTFPVGWDANGTYGVFRGGGGASVSPFPLDVVVGRDGVVRYISREYEADELASAIEAALARAR